MTATANAAPPTIRIGTRGSRLARWQADWVADALRARRPGLVVELVEIKTHGDRDRNSPLAAIGGTGLFTKEIQRAVLDRDVDVAVHSLKDLPTQGPDALVLAAVPAREDVADALIAPTHRSLEALPPGARVGTGSLRRRAQILYARPDLVVSAVLMAMGMMMVPPAIVSLPFKLAFFVVADGWSLISGALVRSYV